MDIPDVNLCEKYLRVAQSAKNRGLEFSISLCTYKNLLRRKFCPYSGVPLVKYGVNNNTSIDRIDNSRGYVPGNVIACSMDANMMKANIPLDMVLNIARVCTEYSRKKVKNPKNSCVHS